MGRAGVARRDCVDVDLRFDVQRDQLDAQGRRPAARLAVLARGARPRARRDHHRTGVAHPAVRHRDRARRPVFDPAGDRRGGHRGWRRLLAAAVPGGVAAAPARRRSGGAVRCGLHRDGFGRGVHPHGRRAGQHDARAPHPRIPARHPGRRSRTGGGDRGLPASLPRRGRRDDAAVGPPRGGGRAMTRRDVRRALKRTGLYAAALGFMLFAGFPFYWMLITAFKQNRDLYVGASDLSHVPWIFNDPPTLEHVRLLFGQTDFPRWGLNTLVVVVAVVAITVAVAVPAGYSLARLAGRWGQRMGMGIFFTYLIPPTLLFVPFSRLISLLGLQNSLAALFTSIPLAIVYNLFIDRFIQGFTVGAVKG